MKVKAIAKKLNTVKTKALVLAFFEKEKIEGSISQIDKKINNELSHLFKSKEFTGEAGSMKIISTHRRTPQEKIILLGLGDKKEFTRDKLRRASGNLAKALRKENITEYTTNLAIKEIEEVSLMEKAQTVAEGTILGLYEFNKYKTVGKDKIKKVETVNLITEKEKELRDINAGIKKAATLAKSVYLVRDLVNDEANTVTPTYLANIAKKIGRNSKGKVKVKVFGKKEITKMKMGGLLGVSKGSAEEPKFIIMDYQGSTNKKADPIVFVGKGITFDSGGLNTKPATSMLDMHADMTGAATVIATIQALCDLNIKKRVIAIVPTCENMNSGKAFKLKDILTAYNGKTMEIHHTDAEGRLILADALSYADKNYKAKCIVDIATLTGASIVALGYEITSLISTDDKLAQKCLDASNKVDEMSWQLPIIDDYKELVKGDIADVRNTAKGGMGPGTITAGIFLSNFVDKAPWAHFDIGATSWLDYEHAYKPKGATGVQLRTFVQFVEDYKG